MNNYTYKADDFLLSEYKHLISIAKKKYLFRDYANFDKKEKFILWRHDIDFSPKLSLKMAEIEKNENVVATYFLLLRSEFYNLFSASAVVAVRKLIDLGHQIGLHFDTQAYGINSEAILEQMLLKEKKVFEDIFDYEVKVFSFHNTTPFTMNCQKYQYAGMVNTYAEYFQKEVNYCSDSNGYWRYDHLRDVLSAGIVKPCQVLTHPVWWTDLPLMPREKITQLISQHSNWLSDYYDGLLGQANRLNLK